VTLTTRVKWLLAICLVALASPGRRRWSETPRVALQRALRLTIDGQAYQGMLYATPGFQRHEQTLGGIPEVAILDISGRADGLFSLVPDAPELRRFSHRPGDARAQLARRHRRPCRHEA